MNENEPISIRPVDNGFIVTKIYGNSNGELISDKSIKVFRSMNELCRFIQEHFEHRGLCIESDT